MTTELKVLLLCILVLLGIIFSLSEISLAAARKMKLQVLIEEGYDSAKKVLEIQKSPGIFFTVIQISVNVIAITAGILGDDLIWNFIVSIIMRENSFLSPYAPKIGTLFSFLFISSIFILIADLIPKRIAMALPEKIALLTVKPMVFFINILRPCAFVFNFIASSILKIFKIPETRDEIITYDDIFAVVDAGAQAGVLHQKEHYLIENIFELESRWVSSAMTPRDDIVYLTPLDGEEKIKQKIGLFPHSKFLICEEDIDSVIGYVDSKELLPKILSGNLKNLLDIDKICNRAVLRIPNTLTLSEVLDKFNENEEDFAIIMNEYAHIVGLITLNDIISILVGNIVNPNQDDQITKKDEKSWSIDGSTPIEDVKKALNIDCFPEEDSYETIAGFLIYMLKCIPYKGSSVTYNGYIFEVIDVKNYKIDQLLVTKKIWYGSNTPTAIKVSRK